MAEISDSLLDSLSQQIVVGSVVFSFEQFKESIQDKSAELGLSLQQSVTNTLDSTTSEIKHWLKVNAELFDENVISLDDFVTMKYREMRVARCLINTRVLLNEFDEVFVVIKNSDFGSSF